VFGKPLAGLGVEVMTDNQEAENHVLVPLSVVELEAVIVVVERLIVCAEKVRTLQAHISFDVSPEVRAALCDAVTLSPVASRLKSLIPEWRKAQYACESPTTQRTEASDGNDS